MNSITSDAASSGCLRFPNHHHWLWSHFRGDINIIVAIVLFAVVIANVMLAVSIASFVVIDAIALFRMLWLCQFFGTKEEKR